MIVSGVRALRGGGGVHAHRGRRGEVEALGPAVDRHGHGLVGEIEQLRRQPPRLVAEHPGGRPGQARPGPRVVEAAVGPPVGGDDAQSGAAQRGHRPGEPGAGHDRQVEEAARAGPHALAVVRVDGSVGEDHGVRARRVGGAQHRARVARVSDIGEQCH
jgi:hypothetical protein